METSLQATAPSPDSSDVFMPLALAILELTEKYNSAVQKLCETGEIQEHPIQHIGPHLDAIWRAFEKASPPIATPTLSPPERLH